MPTFKDANNREWLLTVTVSTVRRVHSATGLMLTDVLGTDLLGRFLGQDPLVTTDVLWAILEPQTAAAGSAITRDQFEAALAGDALLAAGNALVEAIADFFPYPAQREAAKEAIKLVRAKVDELMVEAMNELREPTPGASPSNAPASAASSPAP